MRDSINMAMGGTDYPLRPTFEVVDQFEARFGGLFEHLAALAEGRAPLEQRAFLIYQGLVAADASRKWDMEAVKKRIWENGHWHVDQVRVESDFIERLIYTPEQYRRKKEREEAEKAEAEAALQAEISRLSSETPSEPPHTN